MNIPDFEMDKMLKLNKEKMELEQENKKLRGVLNTLFTKYWLNEDAYAFVKKTLDELAEFDRISEKEMK